MSDGADKSDPVGYGRPPKARQFAKGQSGNPKGRPRRSTSRGEIVRRVLLESRRTGTPRKGRRRKCTVLELVVLLLKQLAATGDQRAYRALMDLERRFGSHEDEGREPGYLMVPVVRDLEEWQALFGAPAEVDQGATTRVHGDS